MELTAASDVPETGTSNCIDSAESSTRNPYSHYDGCCTNGAPKAASIDHSLSVTAHKPPPACTVHPLSLPDAVARIVLSSIDDYPASCTHASHLPDRGPPG